MKFWLIIFSMSSLIIEDLNSFSFLSIIVLKSSLLTSFLSSWTAAAEKKQNKQKKTMCPSNCHHNGFVATHALGHMMYGYKLLVPMNQRMLNKLSKEQNISGHKWSMTHRVLKSHRRGWAQYICYHESRGHIVFMITYFRTNLFRNPTWRSITPIMNQITLQ